MVTDEVDTRVERTGPVLGDGIVFDEGVVQVVGVTVANLFDAEMVNDEGEHDGAPLVSPEARIGGALVAASNIEVFLEELVGEDSGLRKSVNAATNFRVDPAAADAVGEVIF